MSARVSSQPIQAVQFALANETIEDDRITHASKGIFQTCKEKVVWTWNVFIITFGKIQHTVSILVFRALDLIHPGIAPRIEAFWLRVEKIWDQFCSDFKEKQLKDENRALNNQNRELCMHLERLKTEINQLRKEMATLQNEKEDLALEKNFLAQDKARLVSNTEQMGREIIEALKDREKVQQGLDLVCRQMTALSKQKKAVIQQRDGLQQQVDILLQEREYIAKEMAKKSSFKN